MTQDACQRFADVHAQRWASEFEFAFRECRIKCPIICPSSVAERLRRRLCNQMIAGSNPASGHLATPFRKEILVGF